jgi:hypothetical protein
MPRPSLHARDIEVAVANWYGHRANLIVPNVWWGWGMRYEADLVVLRPSGCVEEVEIKVTASDIRAERKKSHLHDDPRVRRNDWLTTRTFQTQPASWRW